MSSSQQLFARANSKRKNLSLIPKVFQENLHYMEYKIRKQMKSFTLLSICGSDRSNFNIEHSFQRAFLSMNFHEKVEYYSKWVDIASECSEKEENDKKEPAEEKKFENLKMIIQLNKGFKWEEITIEIKDFKVLSESNFNIDLRNYLMRVSKKKDRKCYVLESIKKISPETIRFAFLSNKEHEQYYHLVRERVFEAQREWIKRMIEQTRQNRKFSKELGMSSQSVTLKKPEPMRSEHLQVSESVVNVEVTPRLKTTNSHSICEQMMKSKEDQEIESDLQEMIEQQDKQMKDEIESEEKSTNLILTKKKYHKNLFPVIFPHFALNDISSLHHFKSVYQSGNERMFVYQNTRNPEIFKMQMNVDFAPSVVCDALSNLRLQKAWHPEIEDGYIKLKISSENSCIAYRKEKPLNEWYRERDFVSLIHTFKEHDYYYFVEKSIENINFIPFQSIIRGDIKYAIWRIIETNKGGSTIFMALNIEYNGLLNLAQKTELTLRYLKGFENLENFFMKEENQKKLITQMKSDWEVQDNKFTGDGSMVNMSFNETPITYRTVDFEENISEIEEEDVFYTINDNEDEDFDFPEEEVKPEKNPHEEAPIMIKSHIFSEADEKIKLTQEGLIILPSEYLGMKHNMVPYDVAGNPITLEYQSQSIVLKDDWKLEKKGGLRLINQKKIDAQDSVFKFIMGKIKKNIMSGKGGLNISLPVYIFNIDSNLQRTCKGMCMAPYFLEKAVAVSPVERMKYILAFGLSNTILWFDVEKPFNPILGETYQGFIRGCPIYAEQVSHHPPVTAIYMVGRGYKIHASLEAKVNIHMNSGQGINYGFYTIEFDDGQKVSFQTPPGQLSGLAFGDRKFRNTGKGYYVDKENGYFCEMKFEDDSGMFSKNKWEYCDQIEGNVVKVSHAFISKFLDKKNISPGKNDIEQTYFSVSGRWPLELRIDNSLFYSINTELPDKLVDYQFPLHSNSNYREDLYYRKMNDLDKSQEQKERLENIQRGDRKFREKFHEKPNH